jgi:hypothetical protein
MLLYKKLLLMTFGMILVIVNSLHKGDNKDDDDNNNNNNNNTYKLISLFTEDTLQLHCKYLPVNVCGNNVC